tara:strand:- start:2347 stop:4299 length:1953 start_codon:yes stop_codon:yes gene_type:complete
MNIVNIAKSMYNNLNNNTNNNNEEDLTIEERLKKIENNHISSQNNKIISEILNINFNDEKININERVYDDLEFFSEHTYENNEEKTIYSKINHTKTIMGNIFLKNILKNPIKNINKLKNRQSLLKKYMEIEETKKIELNNLLNDIKNCENDICWFWNNSIQKHMNIMYDLVYLNLTGYSKIDNKLNNNQLLLSIFNFYRIFLSPITNILSPLSAILIPLVLFICFKKFIPFEISTKQALTFILKSVFNVNLFSIFSSGISIKKKILGIISVLVWVFFYFQNVYMSIKLSKNIYKTINLMHMKMKNINKFINKTKNIIGICKHLNLNILNIDLNNINDNIEIFNNIFNSECLEKKTSLFSNKGKILTAFKSFEIIKNKIKNILNYIGAIDYLNSNDLLYNKYSENNNNNNNNNYSFTKYSKKNSIKIKCKNIWNPFLNENKAISNNINIKKNMILTGPNAAGKSTFIKSIAINIILSQTIGICSAKSFRLSPIHVLDTYLHIPDIKGNSSLFEAEMNRSKEYITKLQNNSDSLSFIIIDEIFSSTNYIEGLSGAFAILNKISNFNKSRFIVTTHYTELTKLENENNNINNYKFDIKKDISDNIIFNYKIKKGISEQYIALDLLKKNNFDNDIIEHAIAVSKNIKNNIIKRV